MAVTASGVLVLGSKKKTEFLSGLASDSVKLLTYVRPKLTYVNSKGH